MNVRKIVGSAVITTFVATSLQVAQPPAAEAEDFGGLLGGLIVNPVPNPLCRESNQRLLELYRFSLEEAVPVTVEYYSSFFTGEPLSPRFDRTFQA